MSKKQNFVKVRFLNNVQGSPNTTIELNGEKMALNLKFKDLTGYFNVKSGKYCLNVISSDGNTELIRSKLILSSDTTVVITGDISKMDSIGLLSYIEDLSCLCPGYVGFKFVHAVYGAPNVDVYINKSIVFGSVSFHDVENTHLSLKNKESPGPSNNITVKIAGTDITVLGPLSLLLSSGSSYTVFASGDLNTGLSAVISSGQNKDCEILQKKFNIQKYMGIWYQTSWIPQSFSSNCDRSMAEYTLLNDRINVLNTCFDSKLNVIRTIEGNATNPDPCKPAALRVSFPSAPSKFESPPGPNYLVQWTDYNSAIVGSPDRNGLFILHREKKMSNERYKKMVHIAKKLGYDVSRLVIDNDAVGN
jgi:apolipoprotein D and lipocalin family protein